jgi:hypothetical protein
MNEYMLLFRNERPDDGKTPPSAELHARMKQWQTWINGLASQGHYNGTNRLLPEGKMIRPGTVVTDGPYTEAKEMLGGYVIAKAASLDEAVELAKGCPILTYGGHVEIRPVMPIDDDPASANFLLPVY